MATSKYHYIEVNDYRRLRDALTDEQNKAAQFAKTHGDNPNVKGLLFSEVEAALADIVGDVSYSHDTLLYAIENEGE